MTSEIPDEFDRRGANRGTSNWITIGLQKQSEKIDNLSLEIQSLKKALEKAIPNQEWDVHHDAHVTYKEWEAERERQEAERIETDRENRKFRESLKRDFIKWGLGAVGLFMAGLFFAGVESKFRTWAVAALTQEQPRLEIKK